MFGQCSQNVWSVPSECLVSALRMLSNSNTYGQESTEQEEGEECEEEEEEEEKSWLVGVLSQVSH